MKGHILDTTNIGPGGTYTHDTYLQMVLSLGQLCLVPNRPYPEQKSDSLFPNNQQASLMLEE